MRSDSTERNEGDICVIGRHRGRKPTCRPLPADGAYSLLQSILEIDAPLCLLSCAAPLLIDKFDFS